MNLQVRTAFRQLRFISNNLISSQNPPGFVPLRMRRATLSGSRYLAHDLTDLPVPTEEWNVGKRKFQYHRNAVRSSSLQPQRQPPPVLRQSSTPTILESQYAVPRYIGNITNGFLCILGKFRDTRIYKIHIIREDI